MGMSQKMAKLYGRMERERKQTAAAGRKRGLWGSIGSTLLGGLATVLTAGAALPAVMTGLVSDKGRYKCGRS